MSDNILHLPTDETMSAGLAAIAQALENGGGSGGGGGAPAEHDHPVSDVYIPFNTGGELNTNMNIFFDEIDAAIKNNSEVNAWIDSSNYEASDFIDVHDSSGLEDSHGNRYKSLFFIFQKCILKQRLAPQLSLNNFEYGTVVKIPEDWDNVSRDLQKYSSGKNISVGIGDKMYEPTELDSIDDFFALVMGDIDDVDSLVEKYSEKSLTISIHPVKSNGDDFDYSEMSFSDIMNDDMLKEMMLTFTFVIMPEEDLDPLLDLNSETEIRSQIILHFDELEQGHIVKNPLFENFDQKLSVINERVREIVEDINEVQNSVYNLEGSDININRIYEYRDYIVGGDKDIDYESNPLGGKLYMIDLTVSQLNMIMSGIEDEFLRQDRADTISRMKMGSVFETTQDDQSGDTIYRYIGNASDLNGLSYHFHNSPNWYVGVDDTEWNELEITSLDNYLDDYGHVDFNAENISLQPGEYALFTILNYFDGDIDAYSSSIKCIFCVNDDGQFPHIHIDAVIPAENQTVTNSLSNRLQRIMSSLGSIQTNMNNGDSALYSSLHKDYYTKEQVDNAIRAALAEYTAQ